MADNGEAYRSPSGSVAWGAVGATASIHATPFSKTAGFAAARAVENAIELLTERAMDIRTEWHGGYHWRDRQWEQEWIYTMMTVIRLRQLLSGEPVYYYTYGSDQVPRVPYQRVHPGRPRKEQ